MPGHLLHVGFPKAASKYLQAWFDGHPQLGFARFGLAGFRNAFEIAAEASRPTRLLYRVTSFEGFVIQLQDYADVGRSLPSVTMRSDAQAAVCATLHSLFESATVLIVTRGFRSALYSNYAQLVRSGGTISLQAYLDMADRFARTGAPLFAYDRVISLYRRAFGAANVIVLPYERLRDDPVAFIRALETRLGLDHFEVGPDRIHSGPTPAEILHYPRLTRLARVLPDRLGWERPYRRYVAALLHGRLGPLVRWLPRPRPGEVPGPEAIPAEFLERYRGAGESLRTLPEYRGLEGDYLLDDSPGAPSRAEGVEWTWPDSPASAATA